MKKSSLRDTLITAGAALPVFLWCLIYSAGHPLEGYLILSILLIAPVCEEIIFRGALQKWLFYKFRELPGPAGLAILITSLIFAGAHFMVRQETASLLVFFPSLLLGWHYAKYNSLASVILLHSWYNLAFFL